MIELKTQLQKNYLLLFILLLNIALNYSISNAQSIKDNVVKITSRFPDNSKYNSFGFIFAEKNDTLYIVTTVNILLSKYKEFSESITIEFHRLQGAYKAQTSGLFLDRKCLLLKMKKPFRFLWYKQFCSTRYLKPGDLVWIIGTYGKWNDASRKTIGRVISGSGNKTTINLPAREQGDIGVPVIFNDCIAGMVINDQGNQIEVVDMGYMESTIYNYLRISEQKKDTKSFHLPYLLFGINADIFSKVFLTAASHHYDSGSYHYGLFAETGLMRHLSFRFEHVWSKLNSYSYEIADNKYQFRNFFQTYSFSIGITGQSLYEASTFNMFLGYSLINHNPQLNINNSEWMKLKDTENFNYSYPEKFGAWFIGLGGFGFLSEHFLFGFEVSINYTTSGYLAINPLKPFSRNDSNDWIIKLNFNTAIILGNREPVNTYLKAKPKDPFTF